MHTNFFSNLKLIILGSFRSGTAEAERPVFDPFPLWSIPASPAWDGVGMDSSLFIKNDVFS